MMHPATAADYFTCGEICLGIFQKTKCVNKDSVYGELI